jgi:Flp pilus assembly pilin Flp
VINTRIGTITLARIVAAFISVILVAGLKYLISGDIKLDYSDIYNNVGVGLFA